MVTRLSHDKNCMKINEILSLMHIEYTKPFIDIHVLCFFTGEFIDCLLPPKKLIGTKNHDFMDGKRELMEQYIQVG